MEIKYTILLVFGVILAACVEQTKRPIDISHTVVMKSCVFQNLQTAPDWVCDEAVTGLDIQAVGMAEKSAAGQNYMQDMARISALSHLSEKLKDRVDNNFRQCSKKSARDKQLVIDSNLSDIATIVKRSFDGLPSHKSLIGPEGRIYVLIGLDKVGTKEIVKKVVMYSIKNDHVICRE